MILILRRFSKTVLEISVFYISLLTLISIVSSLLSSPAFIFSPSSPHSSLLQCSFFLAPNTTGFNTSLFYFFIFISSFIFILPFLSYLSRVFYFPNFMLFFLLPVPLLLLEFRQPCSMLRRVHAAVAEATTRAVSIVLAPTSVSRTASSPSPTSAAS